MNSADERLQRLLGGTPLAALRRRLRRAYEQAAPGAEPTTLNLARLAEHEREALAALSARAPRLAASMQIDIAAIDVRLRAAGLASSLRDALARLDGAIQPLAAQRAAAALGWSAVAAAAPHPALHNLLADAQGLGLLKRLAGQDTEAGLTLCRQAAAVLKALPAHGLPRARLAALWLGDAHALDEGRPAATLVLAALRLARREGSADEAGVRPGEGAPAPRAAEGEGAPALPAAEGEGTRAQWAAQGVAVNELARPALSLNLPVEMHAITGEPGYWSLRLLLRQPPRWRVTGRIVYVCENPNLLALAADALGPRCAPLVCTEGMLAAAQRALLAQLVAAGARLLYHGDFDWPGLTIANLVLREFGAAPWRMGTSDYVQAQRQATGPAMPLRGLPVAATWDSGLLDAMLGAEHALPEEALADTLLDDLRAA